MLTDLSSIPSVGLSVCPQSVLSQNGWLDLDAIWDGEWDRSRMGVLYGFLDRRREWAVLGVNLGRPIVTNGDFVTRLFPNYFEQYLLWLWLTIAVPWRVRHRFRPFSRRTVILVRLGRPMLACHIFTFYTDNWRHLATKARTDRRIKRLTLTWKRTKMAKIKDFLVV